MKKSKRTALITAAAMIFAGIGIAVGAMAAMDFDFSNLTAGSFGTKTFAVDEAFYNISVNGEECDVQFYPSESGAEVICRANESEAYTAKVKDDTLYIERREDCERYWYIGIYRNKAEISVCLPENDYQSLAVNTQGGDIAVPEAFRFESVSLKSNSGEIEMSASSGGDLTVMSESGDIHIVGTDSQLLSAQSSSGEVTLEKVSAEEYIQVKTKSGDIELSDARSKAFEIAAGSGDISFWQVIAEDNIHAESGSGDIRLKNSDAKELWIKSHSGDVSGTLLTDKVFLTDTASGSVSVPKSASGGKCEIITKSGDIDFKIGEEKP